MSDNQNQTPQNDTGTFEEILKQLVSPITEGLNALSSNFQSPSEITPFPGGTGQNEPPIPLPTNPFSEKAALSRLSSSDLLSTLDVAKRTAEVSGQIGSVDVGAMLPNLSPEYVQKLALDASVASTAAANALDSLPAQPQSRPTSSASPVSSVSSPQMSARAAEMLSTYKSAFPSMDFTVTEEANGALTIESSNKQISIPVVPANYDPRKAGVGLAEMKTALETMPDTDLKAKAAAAYKLQAAISTQTAANYQLYVNQANGEQNIAALEQMVAHSKQRDASLPHVVASGNMSQQTFTALQALGHARTIAAARVSDLMKTDPVITDASNLVNATLHSINTSLAIEQKTSAQELKDAVETEKAQRIAENLANPLKLDSVAILRGMAPSPEARNVIATSLATNKLKLTPFEERLVSADPETIRKIYVSKPKEPGMQIVTKNLLVMQEAKLLSAATDPATAVKVAQGRVNKLEEYMKIEDGDPRLAVLKKKMDANSPPNLMLTGTDKTKQIAERSQQLHLQYIDEQIKAIHIADVRSWDGAIKADKSAKDTIAQIQKAAPGKPIPFVSFITNYMNLNDGRSKADKITALRALTISSIDAAPDSIIFPKFAVQDLMPTLDRAIAGGMLNSIGFGTSSPFGWN